MLMTMVQAAVAPERETDLRKAWAVGTTPGSLPAGLVESALVRSEGIWRIVTVWVSRDAVLAARAAGRPAAVEMVEMFEAAGAEPSVSMWTVEDRVAASGSEAR